MTSTTHRVLIVDDEPAIRGVLRALLLGAGYRVVEADSGVRAQIEARSHKPDLLLLNLGLPDVDGITVIRIGAAMCSTLQKIDCCAAQSRM